MFMFQVVRICECSIVAHPADACLGAASDFVRMCFPSASLL
jgi:hypothetical protein